MRSIRFRYFFFDFKQTEVKQKKNEKKQPNNYSYTNKTVEYQPKYKESSPKLLFSYQMALAPQCSTLFHSFHSIFMYIFSFSPVVWVCSQFIYHRLLNKKQKKIEKSAHTLCRSCVVLFFVFLPFFFFFCYFLHVFLRPNETKKKNIHSIHLRFLVMPYV